MKPNRAPPLTPLPPRHFTASTKAWWRTVTAEFELQSHHLKLLQAACESWDRYQSARKTLDAEGLTIATRHGAKAHPAIQVERDSRISFVRIVRELDLDLEPPPAPSARPPAMRSNRRGYVHAS